MNPIAKFKKLAKLRFSNPIFLKILAAPLVLISASAYATTYYYVGEPYTNTFYTLDGITPITGNPPLPYTNDMRVTGRITTSQKLAPNISSPLNIGPSGNGLITDWKFSDGILEYNPGNSSFLPTISSSPANGDVSGSSITTNSLGNIDQFIFWPYAPKPPHTVGQKIDSLFLVSTGEYIGNQLTCGSVSADSFCTNANSFNSVAGFNNTLAGKWSSFEANADTGTVIFGIAVPAAVVVTQNDEVNGVSASPSANGNAIISTIGSWPPGFSLVTDTGAVSVAASVPLGSYSMSYQLCDRQSVLACVEAPIQITVKAPASQPEGKSPASVPTLNQWSLMLLSVVLLAAVQLRRSRK